MLMLSTTTLGILPPQLCEQHLYIGGVNRTNHQRSAAKGLFVAGNEQVGLGALARQLIGQARRIGSCRRALGSRRRQSHGGAGLTAIGPQLVIAEETMGSDEQKGARLKVQTLKSQESTASPHLFVSGSATGLVALGLVVVGRLAAFDVLTDFMAAGPPLLLVFKHACAVNVKPGANVREAVSPYPSARWF